MHFVALVCILLAGFGSMNANAQSHALIDRTRSSDVKNLFITQAIEGEFGTVLKTGGKVSKEAIESWRGYGIKNSVGVEVFHFTQFAVSHTLLNYRSNTSALENLRGSRIGAEVNFTFSAPLTNIQFGLGILASQLEYQNIEKSSSFVGAGHFYSMGLNYFVSPNFSVQVTGKRLDSTYSGSSHAIDFNNFQSTSDNLSLGLAIWI